MLNNKKKKKKKFLNYIPYTPFINLGNILCSHIWRGEGERESENILEISQIKLETFSFRCKAIGLKIKGKRGIGRRKERETLTPRIRRCLKRVWAVWGREERKEMGGRERKKRKKRRSRFTVHIAGCSKDVYLRQIEGSQCQGKGERRRRKGKGEKKKKQLPFPPGVSQPRVENKLQGRRKGKKRPPSRANELGVSCSRLRHKKVREKREKGLSHPEIFGERFL